MGDLQRRRAQAEARALGERAEEDADDEPTEAPQVAQATEITESAATVEGDSTANPNRLQAGD